MLEESNEGIIKKEVNETLKEVSNAFKNIDIDSGESELKELTEQAINAGNEIDSKFKLEKRNLPEKTSGWVKAKNFLFYELKVELTPYEQKIEDEINEYLHQEITWKSIKDALFEEVPITFRGKRVF